MKSLRTASVKKTKSSRKGKEISVYKSDVDHGNAADTILEVKAQTGPKLNAITNKAVGNPGTSFDSVKKSEKGTQFSKHSNTNFN